MALSWRSIAAIWLLLLAAAPPLVPWFWSVNVLRSLPLASVALIVLVAGVACTAAWMAPRYLSHRAAPYVWAFTALVVAVALAVPFRETAHTLGDTWVRVRTIANYPGMPTRPDQIAALAAILHAAPLDLVVNVLGPLWLRFNAGLAAQDAVSVICVLEALFFFAGVWRLARRLVTDTEPATRILLAVLLSLSGSLEVFAGYAESAGLVLALAPWWIDAMLTPLSSRRDAVRLAVTWCLLLLAHRLALVLVVPVVWRLALAHVNDARPVRFLAVATCTIALCAAIVSTTQLTHDRLDLAMTWLASTAARPPGSIVLSDFANSLVILAPLATVLAGFLLSVSSVRATVADPRVRMLCVAVLPLALVSPLVPWGRNGLGGQRDWDVSVLLGFALTLTTLVIASQSLSAATLRRAAIVLTPLLALHVCGWVTLQTNERACLQRADALLTGPPLLPVPQQVHLASHLGERCRRTGYPEAAARFYEHAAQINPNANDALRSADAWLAAGRPADARRMLERARENRALLDPIAARAAATIDSVLHVLPAAAR